VVVDTSVWSLALRRDGAVDHPTVRALARLIEGDEDVLLTPIVLQEILQGFRTEGVATRMAAALAPFPILPAGRGEALEAARIRRRCRAHGVAASTVDCQIAACAVGHDCLLLTADRDFVHIARVTPLKLALPVEGE
jgi:predicted nucleic acid-binding protein